MPIVQRLQDESYAIVEGERFLWKVVLVDSTKTPWATEALIQSQIAAAIEEVGPALPPKAAELAKRKQAAKLIEALSEPGEMAKQELQTFLFLREALVAGAEIPPEGAPLESAIWEPILLVEDASEELPPESIATADRAPLWYLRIPQDERREIVTAARGLHSSRYRGLLRENQRSHNRVVRALGSEVRGESG